MDQPDSGCPVALRPNLPASYRRLAKQVRADFTLLERRNVDAISAAGQQAGKVGLAQV
jgi:hypothetical protein